MLSDILFDLKEMGQAPILFDPKNTKLKYPTLPDVYSEETIYRAFITFCKYNSNLPLSEDLQAVCLNKPEDFDVNDTIEMKISKLKNEGFQYENESLQQLLDIINRRNIVHLNLYKKRYNYIQSLRDILIHLQDSESEYIPKKFYDDMIILIDRFDFKKDREEILPFFLVFFLI